MATEALKSDVITDMVASSQTLVDPQKSSHLSRQKAYVSVSNGSLGSSYRMVSIPSNAIIKNISYRSENLLAGTVAGGFDIGLAFPLWDIRVGAVIDQDMFVNSIDVSENVTADTVTPILVGSVIGYDDLNKTVWEQSGSTLDASTHVDIIATVVDTALDTVGKFMIDVEYVTGS